jgi:plasma kallikrein
VPFYFCANSTFDDGTGIFSSRFGEECPNAVDVCCDKTDNLKRFVPTKCGGRNKNGVGFQVSNAANETQFGEFPWHLAVQEINDARSFYICGASLIHPQVALTGAHCVNGKQAGSLNVRAGEWDTQTENEIFPHSDHKVSRVIVHPDFGQANLFNDVALMILETPAKLSAHINTICLPPQNHKSNKETCFVSGWGKDKFGRYELNRVNLKKVQVPVVSQKQCQDSLRNTKLGPRFKLNPSFMCAGGEKDADACTGEFLIRKFERRFLFVDVFSFSSR